MKKIFLVFVSAVTLMYSASAQISKGTVFIGPTVGSNSVQSTSDNLDYSSGNNDKRTVSSRTYTLTTGPQIGFFLTDHLALGASLNYSLSSKNTTTNTTLSNNDLLSTSARTTTSTMGTGPIIRYYFFDKLSKNMFYTQLNGAMGTGGGSSSGTGNSNIRTTYQSNGTISGIFTWNAGGSFGLTHFFTDNIGMDLGLGYSYISNTSNNKSTVNTTSNATEIVTSTSNNYRETIVTHGITLGFGFHWFINKHS